jgi:hypothetical protein
MPQARLNASVAKYTSRPSPKAILNLLVHRGANFQRRASVFEILGGHMQNTNEFDQRVQQLLDMIGGEPLSGSGFEQEDSEPDFSSDEED